MFRKMKWVEKVIDDEIDNIEYWREDVTMDGQSKQEIHQQGRCKWESSSEVKKKLGAVVGRRPILPREEWVDYQRNGHVRI